MTDSDRSWTWLGGTVRTVMANKGPVNTDECLSKPQDSRTGGGDSDEEKVGVGSHHLAQNELLI